jgi:hypothetical protein
MAEGEGQGEAGGVDGAISIRAGPGADEVVPVRVGEEAVAPAAGGRAPRVDGEGETRRHLNWHPPQNFGKLELGPPFSWGPPANSSGNCVRVKVHCGGLYGRGRGGQPPPSSGRKTSGLTGLGVRTNLKPGIAAFAIWAPRHSCLGFANSRSCYML